MVLAVWSLWYLEQQICREQSNWEPREKKVRGTGSETVSGKEGVGLWFIVMGSWTRRVGGPYREVLWL